MVNHSIQWSVKRKASQYEVLCFIRSRGTIQRWMLCEKFGYTLGSAQHVVSRLKKKRLAINMLPDRWELTEYGYKRWKYLAEKENKQR
jgi:hypothetical protein